MWLTQNYYLILTQIRQSLYDNILYFELLKHYYIIILLAAIAALYPGSSLTHSLTRWLTDGSNVGAESHNSVIFQHRDFKFAPKNCFANLRVPPANLPTCRAERFTPWSGYQQGHGGLSNWPISGLELYLLIYRLSINFSLGLNQ